MNKSTLNEQKLSTSEVLHRFNEAFLRHDASLLKDLVAEGCVMESVEPAPDGTRYVGRNACLTFWQNLANNKDGAFDTEDIAVVADRGIAVGIIATPAAAAQDVADLMVAAGVRSILNFAPVVISVPPHVPLRKVDLATELRLLEVAHQLGVEGPVEVVPTWLGAHAVPPELRNRPALPGNLANAAQWANRPAPEFGPGPQAARQSVPPPPGQPGASGPYASPPPPPPGAPGGPPPPGSGSSADRPGPA